MRTAEQGEKKIDERNQRFEIVEGSRHKRLDIRMSVVPVYYCRYIHNGR